ncbi:RNA-directed RNA polymerase (Sad-1), putative [Penicillium digitatum]|uniref:RNA-dependent RNA polymerase n=2 Tax=Penicillium digitatum TaxID=36651 RepID=K9GG53_PEND1|nr:RNA-directed RNA polymerase (Sad-1), putative [Penicillium digitatum Pd1]EKV21105.1 RNA-directed RNA polymerase (Sad-1), putative [Penicillium digitatum Pd1]QQK48204.1 RNA-directed RNA polymerase (Sad-1), putative [Penicillium digitatum]
MAGPVIPNLQHPKSNLLRLVPLDPPRPSHHTTPVRDWITWRSWKTCAVDMLNIPREMNTHDIYDAFNKYGNLISIDVWEDAAGRPDSKGRMRFKPPPNEQFWETGSFGVKLRSGRVAVISLSLCGGASNGTIPSPVRPDIRLPSELELKTVQVQIGVLLGPSTVHALQSFTNLAYPRCVVDVMRRCLLLYFKVGIRGSETADVTQHDYRVKITFLQLTQIYQQYDKATSENSLLIILDSAAIWHRKAKDMQSTLAEPMSWREEDSWYRQTAVTHNPNSLKTLPTNLKKTGHIMDLGRWNVFKITFGPDVDPKIHRVNDTGHCLTLVGDIFKDYNIFIRDGSHFVEKTDRPVPVWHWIDFSESKSNKASALLQDLGDQNYIHLPFKVRYQLEVCLSQGYLSEFSMSREFVEKVKDLGDDQATRLLEFVATEKKQYLDPMEIFDLKFFKRVTDSKIPSYCCFMHTARVTPTTIYYNTPTVDISNRVVREWSTKSAPGRFLRVRFTDERTEGRINASLGDSNDEIYTRVKRTLANGISIGDRHYEFLAFGNSQFREHGAYFFAPDAGVSAATIRAWMGQFNHIRNVAKYAARLGQCFSTTRAFTGSSVQVATCNDVVRNGFTFSDGVGKVSKFLAQMVTSQHNIKTLTGESPSAFQFRLGGAKGMLVVSPDPMPQEVHIRPSQQKFETTQAGLEIIRWSQYSLATLNRQLILVLSALGIPDKVFHSKLNSMLGSFHRVMCNDSKAINLLQKYIDPNQTTLILAQMVSDGFRQNEEPFANTMLELWKSWHLKHLKEKAKIAIDQGANLLGVMDETGVLKGYFKNTLPRRGASYAQKLAALPEIFVQICRLEGNGEYEVIEGLCILARNPSLHPGDIRVVRAVNRPELKGLRDVVVLPQTGDQDIASMCSGGDLDGDDYLIIWDPDLIPTRWFVECMDYKGSKAPDLDHDVTVDEITSFFVTYMKNDCLPRIAHAHLAWADRLPRGVWEEKCIRLAQLHSDAVDYNKSGAHARMARSLDPKFWPHFMEKRFKRPSSIYKSTKILGQLYDAVVTPNFVPKLGKPFDSRILESPLASASETYIEYARELKAEFDMNMRQIMAQYEINTEFEVWSTFVLRHGFVIRDYKMQEDLGRIVGTLRRGFRHQCYDKVGRHGGNISALVIAMYRVTQEQVAAALEAQRKEALQREDLSVVEVSSTELPLISFPWIFPDVLGDVATGRAREALVSEGQGVDDSAKSIGDGFVFTHKQILNIVEDMDRIVKPNAKASSGPAPPNQELIVRRRIDQTKPKPKPDDSKMGVCFNEDSEKEEGVSIDTAQAEENGEMEAVTEDIVEMEGDVQPSALDALINMINS